jgi:AcrR family transcriptional regulator
VPPKKNSRASTKAKRSDAPLRPKEREIYDVAARIFYEKGYAATTNQDVANEVGMLKGSLYYYIDSKEDLLFGVMRTAYDSIGDHLVQISNFEGNELERLRFFIAGYVQLVIKNRVPLAVLERDMRSLSPRRRREVVNWRDDYESVLRDLLRAGQEAGVVRRTIDVNMQSILIFTQMHGLNNWYKPSGARSPTEIAELIADFVMHGVVAE